MKIRSASHSSEVGRMRIIGRSRRPGWNPRLPFLKSASSIYSHLGNKICYTNQLGIVPDDSAVSRLIPGVPSPAAAGEAGSERKLFPVQALFFFTTNLLLYEFQNPIGKLFCRGVTPAFPPPD